jgi:DNA-binding Lrp family transcriptional regulator
MGSAGGRGAREGLVPQEARKISIRCSVRAEATWRRIKKTGKSGVIRKYHREQSELFSPRQ